MRGFVVILRDVVQWRRWWCGLRSHETTSWNGRHQQDEVDSRWCGSMLSWSRSGATSFDFTSELRFFSRTSTNAALGRKPLDSDYADCEGVISTLISRVPWSLYYISIVDSIAWTLKISDGTGRVPYRRTRLRRWYWTSSDAMVSIHIIKCQHIKGTCTNNLSHIEP